MARPAELRQQIEDLALRLIIEDPEANPGASVWMPALEDIRASAIREGAPQVARTAASILDALRQKEEPSAASAVSISAELQEGVTHLQEAMDCPLNDASTRELLPAQDPELLSDFILESREHLANIETHLLTVERNPSDADALNAVFRGFHTIKGLAGFLELWEVQTLAHEVETVLDRARNSQLNINGVAIDVILQSSDYLSRWLAHVELLLNHQESEPPPRDVRLLSRIAELGSAPQESLVAGELAAMAVVVESGETAGPSAPEVAANPRPQAGGASCAPEHSDPPASSAPLAPAGRPGTMAVKIETGKLDYLVDMAGEMVIAESLVRNDLELGVVKSPQLQRKIAHLSRITAELQKTAMAMRLVPIGPLFRRMARLVRDLARQFGKHVEMETQGDEIELDRTIVEELADPLMHMVRNAMDHGIESPADRETQGKTPAATLRLKAHHHAGQVVIEISDDGRGLNSEAIKAKAIQKGMLKPDTQLSDTEIFNLIFEPGFSTAAQVTNVSGRGVGMDVVRRHIEKLRGRIEIRSSPGRGTAFLLKLPLTLAITDGLVVGVGDQRYIIPLFAVREMLRPTAGTIWTVKQRAEMALVRGTLLPVLRLHRLFDVKERSADPVEGVLVVAEVEGQRFCVLVDELIGKQEVVIKTLGETFKNVPGIAGGAILGDGRVGLILDLDRLYRDKPNDPSL